MKSIIKVKDERQTTDGFNAEASRTPKYRLYSTEGNNVTRPEENADPQGRTTPGHPNLKAKFFNVIKDRSLIVDLLAIFFGIGSWVGINGIFLQLPLLVEVAPEYWSLPSYLSVIIQIGNIGPLMYTILQKISSNKMNESNIIYISLGTGTVSSILTIFFYTQTATTAGKEYSVALFILTFCSALNACLSAVLFMPYMGRFKEIYLVSYLFGEGMALLLPSIVALIQGVGGDTQCVLNATASGGVWEKYTPPPRFGTMEFFIFIFAVMLCSCVGFTLLDRLKLAKKQYAAVTVLSGNTYVYEKNDNSLAVVPDPPRITSCQYRFILCLMGVVCFFAHGVFNSIQSYSALPYGSQAYHLTTTLSAIATPVACLLAVFLPHNGLKLIMTLSGLGGVLTVYAVLTAVMSPNPPLMGTTAGGVIVVIIWTLLLGIVSYVKLCISSVMRAQGGKSLVWTGVVTQIGASVGSVAIFIFINYTSWFTAYEPTCG